MSFATLAAIIVLLAFGFIFRLVSVEERRNFFRTLLALLLVVGLISYFVQPLVHHKDLKQLLELTAIVSFALSMVFLLGYIKLDQKVRIERGELNMWGNSNKGKKNKK
ncbi:MAG: hypothetical protein ABGX24_00655 [Aquificota bacterium]|jgi:glucan phosphoethanolaminetransferase (alkaline phosphatase superfamily)